MARGGHLGKRAYGYVRAVRVPFSDLKNLSKGYKKPIHSLKGSQNHENQNILPQRVMILENLDQNLEKKRSKFGQKSL